jgi:dihydroxyacid dehydratase/phosphogluconate dehydratase
MDARTNIAALPGRHVADASFFAAPEITPFKRTSYFPDSKPCGRHVAQDMRHVAGIPLLMTALRGHAHLHGDMTAASLTVAENCKSVKPNPNAVAHVGGKAEKVSHADA